MSSTPPSQPIVQQFATSDFVLRSGVPKSGISAGKVIIKATVVDRAFRCVICPYSTQSSNELIIHVKQKHH